MILIFGNGQVATELRALATQRSLAAATVPRTEVDIADACAVATAIGRHAPCLVVNAAAYTQVDRAESESDRAFRANALGPGVVARACRLAAVPLVHLSTDYVFDGAKAGAYLENDAIGPINVYGRTKAEGEAQVRASGARHVILRTSWVYGAHGQNFLKTVLRLAKERSELRIVADQVGRPTATADIAEAILAAGTALRQGAAGGTFHFAGAARTSWHGFASDIVAAQAKATGRRVPVLPITTADYPTPARRPQNSELDCSLFGRTFGVDPQPLDRRIQQAVAALI